MDDLIAFYAARLDDDEQFIRVMSKAGQRKADNMTPGDMADAAGLMMGMLADPEVRAEVFRWPDMGLVPPTATDSALASVVADRAILARYETLRHPSPASLRDRLLFPSLAEVVLACIRDRAVRFSGHPDYRAEWKP
jgi:hypothetical protein